MKKRGSALALRRRYGRAGTPKSRAVRPALTALLDFVTSGRRYKSQNPYSIDEVRNANLALYGDVYASAGGVIDNKKINTPQKRALHALLDFVVSGRRYESRNPYLTPEVEAAFKALGRDWRKE